MAFAHLSYVRSVRPLSALTSVEVVDAAFGSSDLSTGSVVQLQIARDAGSVTLSVEYSSDEGTTWRSLGSDLTLIMARTGTGYLRLTGAIPMRHVRFVLTPSASFSGSVQLDHRGSA